MAEATTEKMKQLDKDSEHVRIMVGCITGYVDDVFIINGTKRYWIMDYN